MILNAAVYDIWVYRRTADGVLFLLSHTSQAKADAFRYPSMYATGMRHDVLLFHHETQMLRKLVAGVIVAAIIVSVVYAIRAGTRPGRTDIVLPDSTDVDRLPRAVRLGRPRAIVGIETMLRVGAGSLTPVESADELVAQAARILAN